MLKNKNIIIYTIIVILLWAFALVVTAEAPSPTKEEEYIQALDEWIEKLAFCESGNNPDAINPHDNGSPSYGYLQYKMSTWTGWIDELGLSLTPDDITSRQAQIELTRAIIIHDWSQWSNWYNCHTKYGVPLPPMQEEN